MLKKSLLLFAFIFSVGFSQTNFVKAEILGPGILGSLNYERMVGEKLGVRVGYGGLSLDATDETDLTMTTVNLTAIPIGVFYNALGQNNHKLSVGGGIDMITVTLDGAVIDLLGTDLSEGISIPFGSFGYRYHRATGGFHVSADYYIMMVDGATGTTVGLGIGWSF